MSKGINKRILVIIPCYNEEGNVVSLNEKLRGIRLEQGEVVPLFINDCSTDDTLGVLRREKLPHLNNPVNLRIGGTVQTGLIYAFKKGFDYAVQMDGDGQHPPSELHKLIEPLLSNRADVVIGSRFLEKEGFQSSAMRRTGIKFFSWLNRFLVGVTVKDPTSGYRAYNRKAVEVLTEYYPDEYPEPEAIVYLAHKGMRMTEVPVVMEERQGGVSSIRSFGSIYYMVKVSLNSIFLHLKMLGNG